jgi:hypothetical protein
VVVASHDRWLRRRWEGEELALAAADRRPAVAADRRLAAATAR